MILKQQKHYPSLIIPLCITLTFFIAYCILSFVRHDHYQSFGYDLGINDQTVWRYSQFQNPITTIDAFPDKTKLATHVELVYALLSPFYWIWSSRKMLLLLEPAFVCSAAFAIYLLARKRDISELVSNAIIFSYLAFYGVQNALWFDVHSITFGAAFVAWFIYFLDTRRHKWSLVFLLLAITSKENVALVTFLISFVYFIHKKDKTHLLHMAISFAYLLFIYKLYFPYIVKMPYLYQNKGGLLSNLNPLSLFDTKEKLTTIVYSFASWGFIPLLSPLTLLPILGDFATYFVLGSELSAAQGIFGHYRVLIAPLLAWSTIEAITRFKKLDTKWIALVLIFSTIFIQYWLHLPLSYLTKKWFWTKPSGVRNINEIKKQIPDDASIVAQNNIVPHISHRDKIYTLYPEKKHFESNSPCGQPDCNWFRWFGQPEYLFVDLSPEWDARHLLVDREQFTDGIHNLERVGIIHQAKKIGNSYLFVVLQ